MITLLEPFAVLTTLPTKGTNDLTTVTHWSNRILSEPIFHSWFRMLVPILPIFSHCNYLSQISPSYVMYQLEYLTHLFCWDSAALTSTHSTYSLTPVSMLHRKILLVTTSIFSVIPKQTRDLQCQIPKYRDTQHSCTTCKIWNPRC